MMKATRSQSICGTALLLVAVGAMAQTDAASKPLGEAAREQQQLHKQQKPGAADKTYADVGTAMPKNGTENPKSPLAAKPIQRSVLDRSPIVIADFIVVPAGTEIRVDIVDGKVIVPVRVGFSTPVPALSPASVKVNRVSYAPISYNLAPGNSFSSNYAETAELTGVTVDGETYPVEARSVALNGGATLGTSMSLSSSRDATFVLTAPLAIKR